MMGLLSKADGKSISAGTFMCVENEEGGRFPPHGPVKQSLGQPGGEGFRAF